VTLVPVEGKLSATPLFALYLNVVFVVLLIVTTPVEAKVTPVGNAPTNWDVNNELAESRSLANTPKPNALELLTVRRMPDLNKKISGIATSDVDTVALAEYKLRFPVASTALTRYW
jgi:hypothetical protein